MPCVNQTNRIVTYMLHPTYTTFSVGKRHVFPELTTPEYVRQHSRKKHCPQHTNGIDLTVGRRPATIESTQIEIVIVVMWWFHKQARQTGEVTPRKQKNSNRSSHPPEVRGLQRAGTTCPITDAKCQTWTMRKRSSHPPDVRGLHRAGTTHDVERPLCARPRASLQMPEARRQMLTSIIV